MNKLAPVLFVLLLSSCGTNLVENCSQSKCSNNPQITFKLCSGTNGVTTNISEDFGNGVKCTCSISAVNLTCTNDCHNMACGVTTDGGIPGVDMMSAETFTATFTPGQGYNGTTTVLSGHALSGTRYENNVTTLEAGMGSRVIRATFAGKPAGGATLPAMDIVYQDTIGTFKAAQPASVKIVSVTGTQVTYSFDANFFSTAPPAMGSTRIVASGTLAVPGL